MAANQRLEAEYAERERAEAALAKARTELARVARLTSMGVLAAAIAHEVNQPLAAIVTNSEAALRWLTNRRPNLAEANAALRRIASDANRASDVIQRIRALITEGKVENVDVDVNDAIREVVTLMRGTLHDQRVAVRLALRPDVPLVSGDRLQLQQAIMNLVGNAADAMTDPDGGLEIVIRSSTDEAGGLLVSVEDRGRGLDLEAVEHLFDPFFTTKPDGMGMGLAIARWIIEAHGGRLWASSASPNGTVLQFTLPGADAAPP